MAKLNCSGNHNGSSVVNVCSVLPYTQGSIDIVL